MMVIFSSFGIKLSLFFLPCGVICGKVFLTLPASSTSFFFAIEDERCIEMR